MSKDDIINKLVQNKIVIMLVTGAVISAGAWFWNLNGRIKVIESGKAERLAIVSEMSRMKDTLWNAHKRQGVELKALHIECAKNSVARSLLHPEIH